MLEMLKARKEELQARGEKGFTLMEMLIVIAIIAILIAIAIPLFTAQMDSAKHAADESNGRSIYAMAMADYMDNGKYDSTYTLGTDNKVTVVDSNSDSQVFEFSDICTVTDLDSMTNGTNGKAKGTPSLTLTWSRGGFDPITFPTAS